MALTWCCQVELEIRRLQHDEVPLLAGGKFRHPYDEAAVPILIQQTSAPEFCVRAALAWLSRAEADPRDMRFFDDEVWIGAQFTDAIEFRYIAESALKRSA